MLKIWPFDLYYRGMLIFYKQKYVDVKAIAKKADSGIVISQQLDDTYVEYWVKYIFYSKSLF